MKWDDKGLPVTVYPSDCQVSAFPLKVAQIMGATQTKDAQKVEATAQPSALPTDLSLYKQAKTNGGSNIGASWFAVAGTSMAVLIFAVFLA